MAPRNALDTDQIVVAAIELIDREPPGGMSMRKLGAALAVDPMAIYHHVANRESLVVLALERVLADELTELDGRAAWDVRVRAWARGYRALVARHRTLTYEALRTPDAVDRVGLDATRPLVEAIAAAGIPRRRAAQLADVVVDYVHGHALALTDVDDRTQRRNFDIAIDTIIDGIRSRGRQSTVE